MQLVLDCEPMFDYGRRPVEWSYAGTATTTAWPGEGVDLELRLTTDLRLGFEAGRAMARTLLKDGETRFCALSWSDRGPTTYGRPTPAGLDGPPLAALAAGTSPTIPGANPAQRAHAEGADLRADRRTGRPTTSLPETPGGQRNWDYRFSWMRDSTFALWGLYTLGYDWEANDFFWFIADVAEQDADLQVMYGIDGRRELDGGDPRPPRGATRARPGPDRQRRLPTRQHDVWGAVLDSVYLHTKTRDGLDERLWPILRRQVEAAFEHWREPDSGMWEVRGEPTLHLVEDHVLGGRGPRAPGWPRLERTSWRRVGRGGDGDQGGHLRARARRARGLHPGLRPDGARRSLLMPLVRFLPPTTAGCATVRAIADELTVDGLGAALPGRGDRRRAGHRQEGRSSSARSGWCRPWSRSATSTGRELCEKLLSLASPLDLYAEEIDPPQRATSATSRRPSPTWR